MVETSEVPGYNAVLRKIDVDLVGQTRSAQEIIRFLGRGELLGIMKDEKISGDLRAFAHQTYLKRAKEYEFGSKDAIGFLSAFPAASEKEREMAFAPLIREAINEIKYSRLLAIRDNDVTINGVKVEVPQDSRNLAGMNVEHALDRHFDRCASLMDGWGAERSRGLAGLLAVIQEERHLPQSAKDRAEKIINLKESIRIQEQAVGTTSHYTHFRVFTAARKQGKADYNRQVGNLQESQKKLATLLQRR